MTRNQVSTLRRGLLVLEQIRESPGMTLTDIMERMELSKSTAFRILTTLEEMNYIYKIKTNFFFNSQVFQREDEEKMDNKWTSLHSIYQMAKDIKMSTYLGKLDETDLVMQQVLHAPYTKPSGDEMGNRSKVHLTALGKVILAHFNQEKLSQMLNKLSLEPATPNTFQDSQLFRYHLKAIYHDGYAFDDEERNIGIRCIAVPVFRNNQEVIAALAIAAPTEQITRSNMKEIVTKLTAGSKAVSQELEALYHHK